MTRRIAYLWMVCALYINSLAAQEISSLGSRLDNDLTSWVYYDSLGEEIGTLEMTWPGKDDWTEWNYRLGDDSGDIQLKWSDDPNLWELTGYSGTITMRTQWARDFSVWRVQGPDGTLVFRSRYRNDFNEWYLEDESRGVFAIYTTREGDPRDWDIVDELDADISLDTKLSLIFLAMYHSILE